MKIIDRPTFWATLGQPVRPLTQDQVNAIGTILDFYDNNNYDMTLGGLGSYLGQSGIESNYTWMPIREMGARNYFRYLIGKLGITNLQEAYMFRGWGRIQTTGKTGFTIAAGIINGYFKETRFADCNALGTWLLDPNHDKNLESLYDLIVSFTCVTKGLYTGKKMNDYSDGDTFDFKNARRVVNPAQVIYYSKYKVIVDQIVAFSTEFYNALNLIEESGTLPT